MKENISAIKKFVINGIEETAFNYPLISSSLEDILKNKKEAKTIPLIIPFKGFNSSKIFSYTGYLLRHFETSTFNFEVPKENIPRKPLRELTNYLDESDIVGFGQNIKPFLIKNGETVQVILDDLIRDLLNLKFIPKDFREKFYNNEAIKEAHLRFFYWGYCLKVAYEILNFKSAFRNQKVNL